MQAWQDVATLGRIRSGEKWHGLVHGKFSRQRCPMVENPIRPKDEGTLAIWRVGLLAYRDARRREMHESECCKAGREAMLAAYPHLSGDEASRHIVNAVAWASVHHREWLDRGVPRREWIWPPDHRGVGHQRNPGYEDA